MVPERAAVRGRLESRRHLERTTSIPEAAPAQCLIRKTLVTRREKAPPVATLPTLVTPEVLQDVTDKTLEAIALIVGTMGGTVSLPMNGLSPEGLEDLNRVMAPVHVRARFSLGSFQRGPGAKVIMKGTVVMERVE